MKLLKPRAVIWPHQIKYERIGMLGKGAFGTVWLAICKDSSSCNTNQDLVAIKSIDISSDLGRSYAMREIQVLSELNHPYCTKIIETIKVSLESTWFIVMTLGKGPTIYNLVKFGGAFGLPLAKHISRQLIEVIAYLHSNAVLYRDIKPENCILVGADYDDDAIWSDGESAKQRVKERKWSLMLVDFGFSRALCPGHLEEENESNNFSRDLTFSNIDAALLPRKSLSQTDSTKNHNRRCSISKVNVLDLSAIGTRLYSAPEIFTRIKRNSIDLARSHFRSKDFRHESFAEYVSDYSMAADAYSLGCLLRFIFTGVPPHCSVEEYIELKNSPCAKMKRIFLSTTRIMNNERETLYMPSKRRRNHVVYRHIDEIPSDFSSIISSLTLSKAVKRLSVRECLRRILTQDEINALSFSLETINYVSESIISNNYLFLND